jgi:hypothetical protein
MPLIIKHLFAAGIVAVSLAGSSPLAAQTAGDVPPGLFASWSDAQRKTVPTQTIQKCTAALGLSIFLPDPTGTNHVLQARWAACVVNKMPTDWPYARRFRDDFKQHVDEARRLSPDFQAPVLKPETAN